MFRRVSLKRIPSVTATHVAPNQLVVATSRDAHGRKKLRDILLAIGVMQTMRIKYLALHSDTLIKASEKVFGCTLTHGVVKRTFFRHFCGGEYTHELQGTTTRLAADNVGSIFDYAAEAEEASGEEVVMKGMTALSTATIVYGLPTERFDQTMTLNLLCIGQAKLMRHKIGTGFAAIKLSGLCEPMLLARVSALMLSLRQAWVFFFKDELPPLEHCRVVVGHTLNDRFQGADVVRKGLQKKVKQAGLPPLAQEEEDAIMKLLDPKNNGNVDYLRYTSVVTSALLDPSTLTANVLAPYMKALPCMTEEELTMWRDLERRVGIILAMAVELKVKVTVDAEQSFFQMAIDYLVRCHQFKYNRKEPVIYNTYQCYLNFTTQRLVNDLARAEAEGWSWAGKMVRGAYMNAEAQTAASNGYDTPVWTGKTKEEGLALTHACYDSAAARILDLIAANPDKKYGVLFGTHNQNSVTSIANRVLALPPNHSSSISFAQLLGMADHLTVALARSGLTVFKYVPYGPVKETILYLGRRAKENNDVLAGARPEEFQMLKDELMRRLRGGRRDKA